MSVDDVQIGKNFARLRGELSQKDVADLMRARGFRWSQATVWAIEKGERPLRLAEAESVTEALGQPFFDLTADDGLAVVNSWMRECSQASQAVREAVARFESARMNLALSFDNVAGRSLTVLHADAGGWLDTTVEDLVREHRDRDFGDEDFRGVLTSSARDENEWMKRYNQTIAKEYPVGEPEAAD